MRPNYTSDEAIKIERLTQRVKDVEVLLAQLQNVVKALDRSTITLVRLGGQ